MRPVLMPAAACAQMICCAVSAPAWAGSPRAACACAVFVSAVMFPAVLSPADAIPAARPCAGAGLLVHTAHRRGGLVPVLDLALFRAAARPGAGQLEADARGTDDGHQPGAAAPEALHPVLLSGYRTMRPLPPGYAEHEAALLAARRLYLATWHLANPLPAEGH